ncbi:ankyrin repeat protein [Aspergillus alliaceus]|uniref:Ankyrin repeat protein n=1 Tax=Petromyces alliaceus TaxID=209559 RepID=A0A5N7CFQ7_PETAA|nr:ankyrin repeat protein [Aspergillus alliaceus]
MSTARFQSGPTAAPQSTVRHASLPDVSPCGKLFQAAKDGNTKLIEQLVLQGADINQQCMKLNGYTPLIVAAIAGQVSAVEALLRLKADPNIRDSDGYKVSKLAIDANQMDAVTCLINWGVVVTDPRVQEGKDWLTEQYELMWKDVKDPDSKPPRAVLDYINNGYPNGPWPDKRSILDVYWEHILLQYIGDQPLDIQRNVSTDLILPHSGTFCRILSGHAGYKEAARLLYKALPTTKYIIKGTVVDEKDRWVTERWGYLDTDYKLQVEDGIDAFLINKETEKIEVMMINFSVGPTGS